ncbi:mannose-1-phosphate guanylyltransferase/mannose-6-phosphate isomerase [Chromatium okenii]|uniref:mannose-1-phosphate guanylyltransferase/mannose-6-phosphate isomerase n=1 Tax=Chromatium okenii TaxID=61644 RepID=UPI001903EF50|nr:mannose-1-phosphate guanylyltransferase/mannose-6-phosphate isomerase [Chromatium okenii]MBK1642437.1 mannose-1-phosphate guanylyltransferase/mannose-6-phosphate isomerase [Chromatium okenii]
MSVQPVILSGGAGTRLWPLSREAYPKQFLPLTSAFTMLQETVQRLAGLEAEHPRAALAVLAPIVVCNEAHRFLVAEQLRNIAQPPAVIVLESVGRNTAPALTVAALAALRNGADPILLVMPADHTIRDAPGFRAAVADAVHVARTGAVVTFGIVPTQPETGYGYIRQGAAYPLAGLTGAAFQLAQFVEKPDAATAQTYLAAGDYLWNSGIFVLQASRWLALIAQCRDDLAQAATAAFTQATVDGDFLRLNASAFATCPSDSIDYAVMEHLTDGTLTTPAVVIPLAVGWSDVGAWSALWEVREHDAAGNVVSGDAFVHAAHNNLVLAQQRMVAVIGVDDLIVVETPDAVLVTTKTKAQDVKAVTQFLQQQQRDEHRHHQQVHRPWGSYEAIGHGARYQVKRLVVQPGESLSLQMHHHRAEHWVVVSGTARVTCDERTFLLTENQSTYIPVGSTHRLENPGCITLELIEVQSGSYLDEDDIVRFEDRYHR